LRPGTRIGVDVGKARIGLASCDPSGLIATPIATISRSATGHDDVAEIVREATERHAIEVVVGLPISLSGARTASTENAREFAATIADSTSITVRMVDERLSTVSAQAALHRSGRTIRNSRSIIDQVAAVIILQHALDYERSGSTPPGVVVEPTKGSP
jgi:putative Holliday junction resolvase